ncbi:hypothetical protein PLICRDRAFT_53961 [Plicaturopsis crispa FD-325 SS-3]|nr:hypothetical protein PLICRDRAFT_53961 [Plicaturopsis crispa FD-325 SS-3]
MDVSSLLEFWAIYCSMHLRIAPLSSPSTAAATADFKQATNMLKPAPLPPLPEVQLKFARFLDVISAYDVCLHPEESALPDRIVAARVLGYLLLHEPSNRAREEVATTILSYSPDHDELYALGTLLFSRSPVHSGNGKRGPTQL